MGKYKIEVVYMGVSNKDQIRDKIIMYLERDDKSKLKEYEKGYIEKKRF